MNKKRFFEILGEYELWKSLLTFSLFTDALYTIVGVGRWGLGVEGNPIFNYIIDNNLYMVPIIISLLVIFLLFPLSKGLWYSKKYTKPYRAYLWVLLVSHSFITWINWYFALSFGVGVV